MRRAPVQPRDVRLLLILGQVVKRELKRTDDLLRGELTADNLDDPDEAMAPGERRAVHVRNADGERVRVGTVRVDAAPVKAVVTDEAAFCEWVQERAPSEIVPAVRSSYRNKVLDLVKEYGQMPDPETKELVDVPGVEVQEGEPRVWVNPDAGAAEVFAGARARGELPQVEELFRRALGAGE